MKLVDRNYYTFLVTIQELAFRFLAKFSSLLVDISSTTIPILKHKTFFAFSTDF